MTFKLYVRPSNAYSGIYVTHEDARRSETAANRLDFGISAAVPSTSLP
jgi:hypothetical protein